MDIDLLSRQFCEESQHIRGCSKETIIRYRRIIEFYARFAGITRIEDVTEKNLRELFMDGRTQRNWSSRTFICYHMSLGAFLKWCAKRGHVERNFLEDIALPKMEKKLPPKLTKQEAFRLLEYVYNYPYDYKYLRYRNHAIFATFIYAGLRRNELLHLKYADVDVENLSIFVRQGKGDKDRVVPMSHTLAQILRRYLEERSRLRKTCPEFFASLNHDMGFTGDGLKHLVDRLRKSCRIPFTIHRLRHTFATLMLEGGCDIYSLSRMMGHADIKTTTIYLAASVEHLRGQIGKHPLNEPVQRQ